MAVLDLISDWAINELNEWQSDIIRRLLTQSEVTDHDKKEIYLMLKNKNGLIPTDKSVPAPTLYKKGMISGAPDIKEKIVLKSIDNLKNINAIPDGSAISFGHKGLTVLYGENGSGKSGYARILKKACKARDTKESILPNIYSDNAPGSASAQFKVCINDDDERIEWQDDKESPDILANIAVFDSLCARIILNEKNELSYLPYGAHVFEMYVSLMKEFRNLIDFDKPKIDQLDFLNGYEGTCSYNFIEQLNYNTSESEIKKNTDWSDKDEREYIKLQEQIKNAQDTNATKNISRLTNINKRIKIFQDEVAKCINILSNDIIQKYNDLLDKRKITQDALSSVTDEVSNEPLKGVRSNKWELLYKAAKEYSINEAYPGVEFPNTDEGSRCILCMQSLSDDAILRMQRFHKYMSNSIKKDLDDIEVNLEKNIQLLKDIKRPKRSNFEDVIDELNHRDTTIFQIINDIFSDLESAFVVIQNALDLKEKIKYNTITEFPTEKIKLITNIIQNEVNVLYESLNNSELDLRIKKCKELKAKKIISTNKEKLLDYIYKLKEIEKYKKCLEDIDFRNITKKGKEILFVTPQLSESIEGELKLLNAPHISLKLSASGREGETLHRIELNNVKIKRKINLSDILSEGEQRVVAIAGFLAELSISNHQNPIVFDDPVSSLDHRYREKIAKRLIKESYNRQVIIFTHDIAFLLELQQEASVVDNAYLTSLTVLKNSNNYGNCGEVKNNVPWHAMKPKERFIILEDELTQIQKLYGKDSVEYNNQACNLYSRLRETWEAVIEDDLLYRTIVRHSNDIQTKRFGMHP